ncbi:Protein kinase C signaling pathway involved MAPKK protein [Rhodotorula toruloides]
MSGSAVLPPKRPSRSPLKLQLPGAETPPAVPSRPASPTSPPDQPAPAPSRRPALKLAAVTDGLASLSLAIPKQGPSHYSSALNEPSESDSEFDEDDEALAHRPWAAGEQERMADELLNVINGPPPGLEDELSGRTRRARSNSRVASRRPSFNNEAGGLQAKGATHLSPPLSTGEAGGSPSLAPRLGLYGEHVQAALGVGGGGSHRTSPQSSPALGSTTFAQSGYESGIEYEEEEEDALDISPTTLEDLGRLGEGASGEVRKVLHKPTGIVMARKTITTSPNPKLHKQHLRELLFMRDCTHPNIVQYYGAYLEANNTQIAICMEFCEAGSLERLYKKVQEKGWRTGEKVLGKIAESILEGLVYLHDQKIIHRDIKPSNVLVTRDGLIKLCDFGVSGELVNSFAGTFVGTTFYLSPERIRGGQYSINSDVWSMAVTVLEVALNRFPFPAEGEAPLNGPIELLTYLLKMDAVAIPDDPAIGIKYTNAFRNFIQVCLDKDPATRPGPQALLSHGWIRRSRERQPPADLASWVRGLEA